MDTSRSQRWIRRAPGRSINAAAAGLLGAAAAVLWLLLGTIPGLGVADAMAAQKDACLVASGAEAVAICRQALEQEPRDMDIRLALGRALVQDRHYDQAISILSRGLELEPGNAELKTQLIRIEQLRDEKHWIEKQKKKREQAPAAGLTNRQRVEVERMQIRCTKLKGRTALDACNQGLALAPGNLALYTGKANVLMAMGRYGEALEALEDARTLDHSNAELGKNIAKARALRQAKLKQCLAQRGPSALAACGIALQKGGSDEVRIRERQGDLLAAAGKTDEAVAAYRAALSAGGGNRAIAAKLRNLMPAGGESRQPSAGASTVGIKAPGPISPAPKTPESRASISKTPQPSTAAARSPARMVAKPKPAPKAMAPVEPENNTIVAKVEKKSPEDNPGIKAMAPAPPKKPVPARLPAAPEAEPRPPAAVANTPGTFSNAPLPTGFTH